VKKISDFLHFLLMLSVSWFRGILGDARNYILVCNPGEDYPRKNTKLKKFYHICITLKKWKEKKSNAGLCWLWSSLHFYFILHKTEIIYWQLLYCRLINSYCRFIVNYSIVDWFCIWWCWCYRRRNTCCYHWAPEIAKWGIYNPGESELLYHFSLYLFVKINYLVFIIDFSFFFCLQSIINASNKFVFIIEENQYKGGLEGSIPVLIQSVSSYAKD